MAIRKILTDGDPSLRKKARPVGKVDGRIRTLIDDMAETMYAAEGAGLAAPQVGILRRVVVIDMGEGLIELVDPEIVGAQGEEIRTEGCLSIPGKRGTVARPSTVTVRAMDRHGKIKTYEGADYLAVAFCHEIDHLDGVLYTDKMIEDVTDQFTEED